MTALYHAQSPPCRFILEATNPEHIHDDALLALQDIQSYLLKLGLVLTLYEIKEDSFVYEIDKGLASEKDMILEIIKFKAHGHWSIKEEGLSCQENT